ncbi:MAG: hypothetical protein QME59_06410, partial [Candidatus Hydrothermarchaeota archaeon]|nr:hypothetical protein [Candidatus Hydrothermarchaeota archaeon]
HSIFWIGVITTDEKLRRKLCEHINEMRGILQDNKVFEEMVKKFESTKKEKISQFMEFKKLCNF